MASNSSDPSAARGGGLRSWLRGMVESLKPSEPTAEPEVQPAAWDVPPPLPPPLPIEPVASVPVAETVPEPVVEAAIEPPSAELPPPLPAAPPQLCVVCGAARLGTQAYCDSCGWIFPAEAVPLALPATTEMTARLRDRYDLGALVGERAGVQRFRGTDHATDKAVAVVLVRMALPSDAVPPPLPTETPLPETPVEMTGTLHEAPTTDEIVLSFEAPPAAAVTGALDTGPSWPTPEWERFVLETAGHPFLPRVLDSFVEGGFSYVVLEAPTGRSLWDAWDDPQSTAEMRFGWLRHVAEQLQALHAAAAMPEAIRPDDVVVTGDGRARLADVADLLPLPVPSDAPIRGTHYTAPELTACSGRSDARANLYSFGATLYALHVGRELTEMDFDRSGQPKAFIPRFPDVHPALGRLVMKTFSREPDARFPTDEAQREDPTGFTELIRTLDACARTLDTARLEIAAWTTTGMVRTGNEDAFALLHACESRQDDVGDATLVLLADGMGGYDAGEIAAALAMQHLRKTLIQHPAFAAVAGASAFPTEVPRPEGNAPAPLDVEAAKKLLYQALKDTNRHVFMSSRSGIGKRGMGCTAEAVYVDGRNIVVGHVGDSRTYHLREGRLVRMTRDQTLVNRLVELGTLTAEEAETHPRRNELQQAIGGQPEVEPGIYHGVLKPGDWVVVCSDGVTNHVKDRELLQMLQSEAVSAEMAARRLVNLCLIEGATDNATVVVIRAT